MTGDTYQLDSWCDPHGSREVEGLVAQIQFPTDVSDLDRQDIGELGRLRDPFRVLMMGHRVHFWCVGHADHRADDDHNLELGASRAVSVRRVLDGMFGDRPFYSGSAIESRGRLEAHWPMPSREQMAEDRRVDVFASRLSRRPPLRLPLQAIIGRLPPRIQIREVYDTVRGPTNWMPATRTSRPVNPANPPGDRTGNSPLAVIPRVLRLANQASVEHRIQQGLEEVRPIVSWNFMNHRTGGILIVAAIDIREQGGSSAGRVLYVTDHPGVFREPSHAIGRWRRQPRLETPSAGQPFGRIEYRYFWATRR